MTDSLEFDLTDRLSKSLKVSGLKVEAMANLLGVSRATIANWTSGRTTPRKTDLLAWAHYTGVTLEWLQDGLRMERQDS
jgi:transcriptional regulator with XRE-family HTH domain